MGMAEKLIQRLVWKGSIGLGYNRIGQFGYGAAWLRPSGNQEFRALREVSNLPLSHHQRTCPEHRSKSNLRLWSWETEDVSKDF